MNHPTPKSAETEDEVTSFKREGYTVVRAFLNAQQLHTIHKAVSELIENRLDQLPQEHVFYEDVTNPHSLKQIQHVDRYVPSLHEHFHHGVFKSLAERLLEQKVVGRNFQYFDKPPTNSLPTPPHQDGFYFKLNPPLALTMWLALDEVNETNGCVMYLPRSHQKGLRTHQQTNTLGFSQGIPDYPTPDEQSREVAIIAKPGDLLAHHALTIHRAGSNQSRHKSRRALGLIYYGEHAVENQTEAQNYRSRLVNHLREQGRI